MHATPKVIDYLNPHLPDDLNAVQIPVVEADPDTLERDGVLVDDPYTYPIEIVAWPKPDGRNLDAGAGVEGGTTEGTFTFQWDESTDSGINEAVAGQLADDNLHPSGKVYTPWADAIVPLAESALLKEETP